MLPTMEVFTEPSSSSARGKGSFSGTSWLPWVRKSATTMRSNTAMLRSLMKANKRVSPFVIAVAIITTAVAHPPQLSAQTAATELSAVGKNSHSAQWSVQVKMIDPGDVNISASFQIGIYESLLDEVSKTKRFKQVFRDGERTSSAVPDL